MGCFNVKNYAGISSPYEPPEDAELVLETGNCLLEFCVDQVMTLLEQQEVFFLRQ